MADLELIAKRLAWRDSITLYDEDNPDHAWFREAASSDDPLEANWAAKTEAVRNMHRQTAEWILS